MDPATISALLSEGAKLGFVVLLLLAAVVGLVRWVRGLESERKEREIHAAARCAREIEQAVQRIQHLEERAHGEQHELLTKCMDTLQTNARAFERLVDLEKIRQQETATIHRNKEH